MNKGWNFPSNDNGCVNGISDAGIETFKGTLFQSLAKEICQNSLDARKDSTKPVKIDFCLSEINTSDIPGFNRLQEVFILSEKYWGKDEESNGNEKAVMFYKKGLDILNSKKINILRISDFNTTGLTGSQKEKNSPWISLVKSKGVSEKTGTAGGSYGIGKNAPFANSEIRTVFYSTLDENGIQAYQGVAKLASFAEEKKEMFLRKKKLITQGEGFYGNIEDNSPIFSSFSLEKFVRDEVGTDIYILGFIKDGSWKNEMIKATLNSYLLSIYTNDLEVKIDNVLINKLNLETLIQEYADDLTKEYYQVLCSQNTVHKEINFADLGNITLDILIDRNLKKRKVLMARGNGMKIFDKNRISASMQFAGICILKDKRVDEYFRSMESPQHDKWEPDRHKEDRKEAKKREKELSKLIKDEIKELGASTILDEMDAVGASEYLPDEVMDTTLKGENTQESLLNKVSNISNLKKIDILKSNLKGNQIIDEKYEGNDTIWGNLSDDGDLIANKNHNNNSGNKNFNVYEYFGIASDKNEVLLKNPTKIETLKFRLFIYNQEENQYKLSFVPKVNSKKAYIQIYLTGDQGRESATIKKAYDINKNILKYRNDKIYIGDLMANQKYSIIYTIDSDEPCSMEVDIHGYNK